MRIRTFLWSAWAILALAGCVRDEPPPTDNQTAPVLPQVPPAARPAPAAIAAAAEPTAVDEEQGAATVQAQRLSSARAYLEQARAAAEQRHRLAVIACDSPGQGDLDACVAAADDGLQVELQAARAEFEAQMRQPN